MAECVRFRLSRDDKGSALWFEFGDSGFGKEFGGTKSYYLRIVIEANRMSVILILNCKHAACQSGSIY